MTETEWKQNVDRALTAISDRLAELEKGDAVDHVLRDSIDKRLTNIESVLKRLNWMIVGAVVMAMMTYILKGGLQ